MGTIIPGVLRFVFAGFALVVAQPVLAQSQFAGARYSFNGSLDTTFDGDGKVLTNFATMVDEYGRAVTVDAQGRVIIAGHATGTGGDVASQFALARYGADGSLDTSFDDDGKVLTNFASSSTEGINSVAVQADGKIVAGGRARVNGDFQFALARYNTDGTLDTSFDGDGKVLTSFGAPGTTAYGTGVVVARDGKVILCGYSFVDGSHKFAVARYNPDGSLDATFGGGGTVVVDFASSNVEKANGCALTSTGKIVLAGYANTSSGLNFAAARFDTNGSLDTSFDADGKVLTSLPDHHEETLEDVAIDASDRVVGVGSAQSSSGQVFTVVRYTSTGALDTSFGLGGVVITDFPESQDEYAHAVAINASGRIAAAGYASVNGARQFLVARYTSAGFLDSSFDGDGRVLTNFAQTANEAITGIVFDAAGRLVTGGYTLP